MNIIRIFQSEKFILASLAYLLGSGIARYFGSVINMPVLFLGILAVIFALGGSLLLERYFHAALIYPHLEKSQYEKLRIRLLLLSYAFFSLTGAIIVTLMLLHELNLQAGILFAMIVVLFVLNDVPPFSLIKTGYGELLLAVITAILVPTFSYHLQSNEFHRLLPLVTFPLVLLAIAWLLATNFSTYARDLKTDRQSLLIRLTWQRAVPIHHISILLAYLLFTMASFIGISWGLIWPVFLSLPFSIFQIFWLQRIANGGIPVWNVFKYFIPTAYGLCIYFLALAFWLR